MNRVHAARRMTERVEPTLCSMVNAARRQSGDHNVVAIVSYTRLEGDEHRHARAARQRPPFWLYVVKADDAARIARFWYGVSDADKLLEPPEFPSFRVVAIQGRRLTEGIIEHG